MSPQELHYLDPKTMKCFISENTIPVSNLCKKNIVYLVIHETLSSVENCLFKL